MHVSVILLHFVIFLTAVLLKQHNAYYLSYNQLHRSSAESFCNQHCGSNLASIHSSNDLTEIIDLWTNDLIVISSNSVIGDDLWIGLSDNQTNDIFEYTDNSPFDYGTNISGGVYPWKSGEPGPSSYVQMVDTQNVGWQTVTDTQQRSIFVCNDCNYQKINKYILVSWTKRNWWDANTFCNEQFGTSLASIHRVTDFDLAKSLCQYDNSQSGRCWIGLSDLTTEGDYTWSDGTYLDFGGYNNGFTWPWANDGTQQPDNWENEDCIGLWDTYGYSWNDMKCTNEYQFMCNKPSELCIESNWNGVDSKWLFSNCDVTNNNNNGGMNIITLDISNKQWRRITISYLWKINDYYYGSTGIVINIMGYDDNTIYKLYIAFEVINDNKGGDNIETFLKLNDSTDLHREYAKDGIWDSNNGNAWSNYNEMRIEFNHWAQINAKMYRGDRTYNIFDSNPDISSNIPTNWFVKSIGIQNENLPTTAKYLYVNGEYNNDAPTSQPTNIPSQTPSKFPTSNPSIYPTFQPITIQPTEQPITSEPTTITPTNIPTQQPITSAPTNIPTHNPSEIPSLTPTNIPTTNIPTNIPSNIPTNIPTNIFESTPISTGLSLNSNSKSITNTVAFHISIIVIIILTIVVIILIICLCHIRKLKRHIGVVTMNKNVKNLSGNSNKILIKQQEENVIISEINMSTIHTNKLAQKVGENAHEHDNERITSEGTQSESLSDDMYKHVKTPQFGCIEIQNKSVDDRNDIDNASDDEMYRTDLIEETKTPPFTPKTDDGFGNNTGNTKFDDV